MRSSYKQMKSGEPYVFNPQKGMLRIACCDCGLVHDVYYKVSHRQKITRQYWRNERATGQIRRYKGIKLTRR